MRAALLLLLLSVSCLAGCDQPGAFPRLLTEAQLAAVPAPRTDAKAADALAARGAALRQQAAR